jgi:hypothetical protein
MLILASQERARRTGQVVIGRQGVISAVDGACVDHACLVAPGSSENETCLGPARRWPERFRVIGIPGPNKSDRGRLVHSGSRVARRAFGSVFAISGRILTTRWKADWCWPVAQEEQIPMMIWTPEVWPGGQHDC